MEREYIRKLENRNVGIQNSRRNFERNKEGVWRR